MAKKENTTSIGFEDAIWRAADKLRGNLNASEYEGVVLGLIFLKYISDKFEAKFKELSEDEYADVEDKDEYEADGVFFVPQDARWSVISQAAHTPQIGKVIDEALEAIERENTKLKGVLPSNYARPELDKRRLGDVVDLFTNIHMLASGDEKDLLGRVYEYCLQKFASMEGKNAGEFYTPSCIVRTIVEILQPYAGRVYDPCCGSGGMFVQSAKFIYNHQKDINNISVYGQEANPSTWKMAHMNVAIRGLEANLGKSYADTFFDDQHPTLKADFIMANPPFNLSDWGADKLEKDVRWKFGIPPAGNANFAWMQHMIHHLSPTGRIGLVLANGALSSKWVKIVASKMINMKQIIAILMFLCALNVSAQGIKTTFTRKIDIKHDYNQVQSFGFGDSVTVYGYKKKSGVYYYNIETEYYADLIRSNDIPFAATEKELKKLPNALDDEQKDFMRLRKQMVAQRVLALKKQRAFRGDFKNIVDTYYDLASDDVTGGKLAKGDTVYIIGYKKESYSNYQYALYNDKVAGVYQSTSDYNRFTKKINVADLPSVDDPDVIKFLDGKRQEILRRTAEEKVKYRKIALSGKIQGIVSYGSYLKSMEDDSTPLEDKDTVTIVGFSEHAGSKFYALYSYSSGVVGNFKSTPSYSSTFKNASEIDFAKLPAYDDPEVKLVIEQQKQIIDSIMQVRVAKSKKRLEESAANLIKVYKENQPFVVTNISWDSNSAGGIEVSLSITNCTQQTIKYVNFQGFFKNAVGDKCRNEIGGGTVWKARGIGPIGPCPSTFENCDERLYDCQGSYTFDNLTFYSRVANTFKLSSVTVEYTNGKTITLSGANLDKHVRY